MSEYIITVKSQMMIGSSVLVNRYAIAEASATAAKEYAKTLCPGFAVSVSAHKVKPCEEVPKLYYSWLYR